MYELGSTIRTIGNRQNPREAVSVGLRRRGKVESSKLQNTDLW